MNENEINRYAHFGLSIQEKQEILIGIGLLVVLLFAYKKIRNLTINTKNISLNEWGGVLIAILYLVMAIAILFCLWPAILIIYALGMKVLKYGMLLGLIILIAFLIYKSAKRYLEK